MLLNHFLGSVLWIIICLFVSFFLQLHYEEKNSLSVGSTQYSEAINRRMTDNTSVKRKGTKGEKYLQNTTQKTKY